MTTFKTVKPAETEIETELLANAHECVREGGGRESPLVGYVVLAFYGDGATLSHSWRPNAVDHGIGNTLFDAWARETLDSQLDYRRAVAAADNVIDERFTSGEE